MGLLFMTAVIEIFVYAVRGRPTEFGPPAFSWRFARGPGTPSLDHLIARKGKAISGAPAWALRRQKRAVY